MTNTKISHDYRAATPYIIVNSGALALDFYAKAFSAKEVVRLADPSGKVILGYLQRASKPFQLHSCLNVFGT